ncbi:esterase-like activity of phytase family protein [Prevotella jejuni]
MILKFRYIIIFVLCFPFTVFAQVPRLVRVNPQHYFQRTVPKGNYSGLTWLGGEHYAVVSDKASESGFFVFRIQIDTVSGDIKDIVNEGFRSSGEVNKDEEGIAFFPKDSTLWISREADNTVLEYGLNGKQTGRRLSIPSVFSTATPAYSFEALTYNAHTHRFWTTSESTLRSDGRQADAKNQVKNRLRFQSFDDSFAAKEQYAYLMDAPDNHSSAANYAMGVPAMAALDNGCLLVLEREFLVTPSKFGSYVANKIYCVDPIQSMTISQDKVLDTGSPYMKKVLIATWKTSLSLFHQNLANYEGMCLGPRLMDGSQVIVLCADSQDQYGGVLRDWFRTVVIR